MHVYFYAGYYSHKKSAHPIAMDGLYVTDKPILTESAYTVLKNVLEERYDALPEQLCISTFSKLDHQVDTNELLRQELLMKKKQEEQYKIELAERLKQAVNPETIKEPKKIKPRKTQ